MILKLFPTRLISNHNSFAGRQCLRARDQCHPNPCQNHGQCIMDDLKGLVCQCRAGFSGRLCQTEIYDHNDGERYRKSLEHENKEKIQFSLKINLTEVSGVFMNIPLENTEEVLKVGINNNDQLWIEVSKQRLTQETYVVPNLWHKIVISKQNHRLNLKMDHHLEISHVDDSLPSISFSENPIKFTGNGTYFLQSKYAYVKTNHFTLHYFRPSSRSNLP